MLADLAAALRYKHKKAKAVYFAKLTLLSLMTSPPEPALAAFQTAPTSQQRSSTCLISFTGLVFFISIVTTHPQAATRRSQASTPSHSAQQVNECSINPNSLLVSFTF